MSEEYYIGKVLENKPSEEDTTLQEKGFKIYDITARQPDGEYKTLYVVGKVMSEEDNDTLEKIVNIKKSISDWLKRNDYKHNKYLRGDYTEEEWSVIKEQYRQKTLQHKIEFIDVYNALFEKYTGRKATEFE